MQSSRRLTRGLTVIESLVTAGIFLVIMGVLTVTYVQGSKAWKKVDRKTELVRQLQVAVRGLQRELSTSHYKGLERGNMALAYLSLTDAQNRISVNSEGNPEWQKFVLVYVDDSGLLRRRVVARSAPDDNALAFEEETGHKLDDFLQMFPEPEDRFLTHSGEVVEFSLEADGDYGSLHDLSIQAIQTDDEGVTERFQVRVKVSLRNS